MERVGELVKCDYGREAGVGGDTCHELDMSAHYELGCMHLVSGLRGWSRGVSG